MCVWPYRSVGGGLVQCLLEILLIGPHLLLEQLRAAGDGRVHARLAVLRRDDQEAALTLVEELAEVLQIRPAYPGSSVTG